MKKISGNIIFTLKYLLLVVHPTLKFQAHISNCLFRRTSQTAQSCTEIPPSPSGSQVAWQGQRLWWAAPRQKPPEPAQHCFTWKFQLIIYLAFKMILSKSKYIFLQKLPPPTFPFLPVRIIFMDKKRRQRRRSLTFLSTSTFSCPMSHHFFFLFSMSWLPRRTKLDSWHMTTNNFLYTDPDVHICEMKQWKM